MENNKQVINLLKNLVKISSVTDSRKESEPVAIIKNYIETKANKAKIKILGPDSKKILVAASGDSSPIVQLNGHFDVVPAAARSFRPRLVKGKIYGRGAVDAKGPLACLIQTFCDLSYHRFSGKLILTCVPDEENAGERGSRILAKAGIVGDYNIIGEPTNLIPIIAEKGFLRLKIVAHGKSAHAAFPEKGINAIDKLYRAIEKIRKIIEAPADPLLGKPTLNLASVKGGGRINVVPDFAEGLVDIRYLPAQNPKVLVSRIKDELKRLGRIAPEIISVGESFSSLRSLPLVQAAIKHSQRNPQGLAFATDARFFNQKECLILGPGNPNLCHTEKESVSLQKLHRAMGIYRNIIRDLLKPL